MDGEGVVLGKVAQNLGAVGQVPAGSVVPRDPIDDHERGILDLGLHGRIEQLDEVVVGQPHFPGPVVRQGISAISSLLDPANPQRDEGKVEGMGQAPAHPLSHQLEHPIRIAGPRSEINRDRFFTEVPVLRHDVIGAGEDDPVDSGQGGGIEDVGQGVEIAADQLVQVAQLVRVGGQVNNSIHPVEVGDPVLVKNAQVGLEDVMVGLAGVGVEKDQIVDVRPCGPQLAADVTARAGDQYNTGLALG